MSNSNHNRKEIVLYLLFGGLSFVISISSYTFCNVVIGINELTANIISWVLAVSFSYITNRIWVFDSPTNTFRETLKQMYSFFTGRVITLLLEEVILFVFITLLHFHSVVIKVAAQVIVIIANYVISKLVVFKKPDRK